MPSVDIETLVDGVKFRAAQRAMRTTPGMLAYQVRQRKAILGDLFSGDPDAPYWSIVTGKTTAVRAEADDKCPADTLARTGLPEETRLFQGGNEIEVHDTPYRELEGAVERRLVAVAPSGAEAIDGIFHEERYPRDPAELVSFRFNRQYYNNNWSSTTTNPRALRSYQLLRLEDPRFFAETVEQFEESAFGWGSEPVRVQTPILSTYQALYYTSLLRRTAGTNGKLRVLEIGGGFGNLARVLAKTTPQFASTHVIVDLEPMNRLQEWFLGQEFPQDAPAVPPELNGRFGFVDAGSVAQLDGWEPELVIATHSLTELDPVTAKSYLERFFRPARTVLLVGQRTLFGGPRCVDWMWRWLVDAGLGIDKVDAIAGRHVIAAVATRPS